MADIIAPVGSKVTLKNGSVWDVVSKENYNGTQNRGEGGIYGLSGSYHQSWFRDGSTCADSDGDYQIVSVTLPEIDFSKPLQTVGGTEVTLLSTEAKGDFPIVAQMLSGEIRLFNRQGKSKVSYFADIQNAPPKPKEITKYINVYESGSTALYSSRANADLAISGSGFKRIACQKVVLIEGTFDS